MWLFRKRPEELTPEQRVDLDRLLEQIPELALAYHFRWGLTEIFDTATSRAEAAQRFEEFRGLLDADDEDNQVLLEFFTTYDAHREAILAYFDERKTSGPVEGLNNKARMVTKRCYGVKTAQTLWNRLCLDVNLAALAVGHTVRQMHALAHQIRSVFLGYYT